MSTLPNPVDDQDIAVSDSDDASDFDDFTLGAPSGPAPFDINQIPIKISAVLGKVKMDIAMLQSLSDGAIIELDRKVGDPIDLYVDERLIGRGELMMIDGVLGVTLTEIVKSTDE